MYEESYWISLVDRNAPDLKHNFLDWRLEKLLKKRFIYFCDTIICTYILIRINTRSPYQNQDDFSNWLNKDGNSFIDILIRNEEEIKTIFEKHKGKRFKYIYNKFEMDQKINLTKKLVRLGILEKTISYWFNHTHINNLLKNYLKSDI